MDAEPFVVADVRVVTQWRSSPDAGSSSTSPSLSLAIAFDLQHRTATFRLRLPVAFKPAGSKKFFIYVLIHPEHITSFDSPTDVPEHVASALAAEPVGIRIALAKPGGLVVGPAHTGLTPRNKASSEDLDMLHEMAGADEITLYLARSNLSTARVQALSRMAADRSWRPSLRFSSLPTLYSGQGGRILGGNPLAPPSHGLAAESPPSYDELALTPPPNVPSTRAGKKRRAESPPGQLQAFETFRKQVLEECRVETRHYIAEEARRSREESERQLRDLEARMLARLDERIEEKGSQLRLDLTKKIEEQGERTDALQQELDYQVEDMHTSTSDLIDLRLDEQLPHVKEQLPHVKEELTDWVTDEMREAEKRIWDDLAEVTFSANL